MTGKTTPVPAISACSDDCSVILGWVKKAKKIYVPCPGTGGGVVQVNKKDLIALLKECGDNKMETHWCLMPSGVIYG